MKQAGTFACRNCGQQLYLDDNRRSSTGKRIPINVENDENHDCPERQVKTIQCKICGKPIYFDRSKVSISGKKIPLDPDTHEGHQHSS